MLEKLENKYYNFELVDYLKSCSLEELSKITNDLKTSKLNKVGIRILGSVLFALENYDKSNMNQSTKKMA